MRPRFHAGDRVRTIHPINVFSANRCGTILRVFFGSDIYDVLFDGETEPRIVAYENLILESSRLAHEALVSLCWRVRSTAGALLPEGVTKCVSEPHQ